MAISVAFSSQSQNQADMDEEALKKANPRFTKFRDWFIREFSGVTCKDVQEKLFGRFFDFMKEGERDKFYQHQKVLGKDCHIVTDSTAVATAKIISAE